MFFVYENWRARGHKAVIHVATCSFCNGGHGINGGTAAANGQWHGPYPTRRAAERRADQIGARVQTCSFCARD